MTNESLRINRDGESILANTQAPTRRDVLEKAGLSFLVIVAGGFASNASTVGQGENAASSDLPKMANVNEPIPSEHQLEPAEKRNCQIWCAREIQGIID